MTLTRDRALIGRWVPLLAWMFAIFYVSSWRIPPLHVPTARPFILEASFHFAEYFGLSILMHRALSDETWHSGFRISIQPSPFRRLLIAGAASLGYAVSDELHQLFVPGRTFELIDLAVDAIGVAGAVVFILVWQKR